MNKNFFALMRVYVIGLLMTCVIGQPVVMCAANPKPPVASDKKGIASAKNTIIAFALAAGYSAYELHAAYKKAQKDEKKQALLERQKNPEQKEDVKLKITSFWKFICDPVLPKKYLKPTPFLAAIAGVGVGVLLDYKNAPEKPLAAESPKPSTPAPQPMHTGSSAPKSAQPRVTPASGGGASGVTAPLLSVADEARLKEEAENRKAEAARQKAEAEKRKKEEAERRKKEDEARKKQALIAAFQKNATPPVAKPGKILTTKDFKITPDKLVEAYNKYTEDVRTAVQGNLQQYVTAYVDALVHEISAGTRFIQTEINILESANQRREYIAGQKARDNWKPALTGKQLTEKIKKSECACLNEKGLKTLLEAPCQQLADAKTTYRDAVTRYCSQYAANLIVGEQYNRSKMGLSLHLRDKLGVDWGYNPILDIPSLAQYETHRKAFIDAKIAAVEARSMDSLRSSLAAYDGHLRAALKKSLIRVLMVEEDGGKYFQDQYLTAEYGTRFVQYLQAMDALMSPFGGWNTCDDRALEVRASLVYMIESLQGTFYPWPLGDSIKPSAVSIDSFCNMFMTHICCSPDRISFDYARAFDHIELPAGLRFITESLIPAFVRFNSETLLTEDGEKNENMQRRRLAAALMRRANNENRKMNGQEAVIDDIDAHASFKEVTRKLNFYMDKFGISFCTVRNTTHPVGFRLAGTKYVYKGDGWYTDSLVWSARLPEVGDA